MQHLQILIDCDLFNDRVDFKKNEKVYDSSKSQVFKMLQEMDKEPKEDAEPSQVEPSSIHMPTVVYESSRNVSAPPPVAQTTTQNNCNGVAKMKAVARFKCFNDLPFFMISRFHWDVIDNGIDTSTSSCSKTFRCAIRCSTSCQ
jgi:hypothetical protein